MTFTYHFAGRVISRDEYGDEERASVPFDYDVDRNELCQAMAELAYDAFFSKEDKEDIRNANLRLTVVSGLCNFITECELDDAADSWRDELKEYFEDAARDAFYDR